jgi:hypothetical protein
MIRASVSVSRSGGFDRRIEQIIKNAKGPSSVKVGLPAGKVSPSVIQIGFWNHEGTNRAKGDVFFRNGMVGISGPIPARPFITVAMFKGRPRIRANLRKIAKKVVRGEAMLPAEMERLGIFGADLIKTQIGGNMGPPNSPMTVRLKGSSSTLIDSGRMRQSVTHEVET